MAKEGCPKEVGPLASREVPLLPVSCDRPHNTEMLH